MNMNDNELLREYVRSKSEAAFGKLVERHMKMAYWTCRRDVGDDALAEDATQAVFVLLAQKAAAIPAGVSVSGWIFNTARLVSKNVVRDEGRRRRREEAVMRDMDQQRKSAEVGWVEVEPWINDALSSLSPADREIVLLRFFDDLTPDELAVQMGTTAVNIRKRASRAVERLRRYLSKKEVTVTAITLGLLLTRHPTEASPITPADVTQHALHHAAMGNVVAGTSLSASIQKGVYLIMQTTKYKYLATGVILLLVGLGSMAGWKSYQSRPVPGAFTDLTMSAQAISAAKGSPTASTTSTPDHRAITLQLQHFVDALNAHDATRLASVFAPNSKFEAQQHTREQEVAIFRRQFAQSPDEKRYLTLTSLDINGDQATASAQGRSVRKWVKGDTANNVGGMVDTSQPLIIQLEKQNGTWLVVSGK